MNVTDEPAHVGFAPAVIAIATDGTTTGFIVIVIPVLVAVVGEAPVALLVITHVTICPFVKVVVVKVGELVPTFVAPTFH